MENLNLISRSGITDSILTDYQGQEELLGKANTCRDIRKLREGLVSCGRNDEFAVKVYEKSIDLSFQEKNREELYRSVAYVQSLYTTSPNSCRQEEIQTYFLLFLISNNATMHDICFSKEQIN